MTVVKVDHVAVAVVDIDAALAFWQNVLGLAVTKSESVPAESVNVTFLAAGDSHIELIAPTTADSGVARYLEKRGSGIHHLCLAVSDLDATLAHLAANNVELINQTPNTRDDGTRYAFVHPRGTGGVLLELYEVGE